MVFYLPFLLPSHGWKRQVEERNWSWFNGVALPARARALLLVEKPEDFSCTEVFPRRPEHPLFGLRPCLWSGPRRQSSIVPGSFVIR
jgi:hypothetical protein